MQQWELHIDPPASGGHNMAKDQFLLERAEAGGIPILRLYQWEGLTLSVGHAQKVAREINLEACLARGVPLVRRPTGGRAVLHGGDLTYAVAAPTALPVFAGGIMAVYKTLSEVFLRFLGDLGLHPEAKNFQGRDQAQLASAICFATPAAFEMLVDGRKLVGSAQRMRAHAFLQHGSLPLAPQFEHLLALFNGAGRSALEAQMTDLESLGVFPQHSVDNLQQRLVKAFEEALNIRFTVGPWSAADEASVSNAAKGAWVQHMETPAQEGTPSGAGAKL